jgi:dCTP deaminase
MALSDKAITSAIKTGQLTIRPGIAKLGPAGVDLRVDRAIRIRPGKQVLVATIEHVELSEDLVGILHIRSSLAREGLVASLALVDPGFRGQLTVSLYNAGDRLVSLRRGERCIQITLIRLNMPSSRKYSGKYQDSRGVVTSRRQKNVRHVKMENVIRGVRG